MPVQFQKLLFLFIQDDKHKLYNPRITKTRSTGTHLAGPPRQQIGFNVMSLMWFMWAGCQTPVLLLLLWLLGQRQGWGCSQKPATSVCFDHTHSQHIYAQACLCTCAHLYRRSSRVTTSRYVQASILEAGYNMDCKSNPSLIYQTKRTKETLFYLISLVLISYLILQMEDVMPW